MQPEAKKFLYDMQQACSALTEFIAEKSWMIIWRANCCVQR